MPTDQEFERAKAAYQQNFEQFRSLNQSMWQVPVIAMTLTGGLWFGAAKIGDMPGFQNLLLILAAAANLGLVAVLERVRYVMGEYLKKISAFDPDDFVAAAGKWLHSGRAVAITFQLLLAFSALISLGGIYIVNRASSEHSQHRRTIEVIDETK